LWQDQALTLWQLWPVRLYRVAGAARTADEVINEEADFVAVRAKAEWNSHPSEICSGGRWLWFQDRRILGGLKKGARLFAQSGEQRKIRFLRQDDGEDFPSLCSGDVVRRPLQANDIPVGSRL
jgi:hypothetical protein